jgi:hypothetical protein
MPKELFLTLDEVRDRLRLDLENTAEWRRSKAAEHPDDERNLEAANLLDMLAATVGNVPDAFIDAYGALWDEIKDSEHHSGMLRQIGFHSWHANAEEFVKEYIANRTGGR